MVRRELPAHVQQARADAVSSRPKFQPGDKARLGGSNSRPLPTDYPWLRRGRVVTIAEVHNHADYLGRRHLQYLIRGHRGRQDALLPSYYLRRVNERDRAKRKGAKE